MFYVVDIWKRKVLGRGNVAQECCSCGGCNCAAYGRGYVVIARCDVSYQRSQNIERRTHTDRLLDLHIRLDLVKGHMSGAFDHDLDVLCPSPFCKLAKAHQLLYLANITCICEAARTAGITQGDGHIILTADVKDLVKVLIKGVFLPGHAHPGKDQRAATGYDIHFALMGLYLVYGLSCYSAVQGHKVHSVLCMEPYHVDKILSGQGGKVTLVMDNAVVNRDSAYHGFALAGQFPAERLGVAM